MFIVTRTFRDANGVFPVGSIVDATKVRTFKSRLADRHIVDVNEQNVKQWETFFTNRYGIDLSTILNGAIESNEPESIKVEPITAEVVSTEEKEEIIQPTSDEKSDW